MKRKDKGFTLLELLIVIAIVAILAAILIWVLNPAEMSRRGRDSQRISDLKTLHRALGLYITVVPNPTSLSNFCGLGAAIECSAVFSGDGDPAAPPITGSGSYAPGADCLGGGTSFNVARQDIITVAGNGWVPADFTQISGGSPVSRLPLDPSFLVNNPNSVTPNDRLYIFVCKEITLEYEIMANLESDEFKRGGPNDKESTDGGDSVALYEVGTNLNLLTNP